MVCPPHSGWLTGGRLTKATERKLEDEKSLPLMMVVVVVELLFYCHFAVQRKFIIIFLVIRFRCQFMVFVAEAPSPSSSVCDMELPFIKRRKKEVAVIIHCSASIHQVLLCGVRWAPISLVHGHVVGMTRIFLERKKIDTFFH